MPLPAERHRRPRVRVPLSAPFDQIRPFFARPHHKPAWHDRAGPAGPDRILIRPMVRPAGGCRRQRAHGSLAALRRCGPRRRVERRRRRQRRRGGAGELFVPAVQGCLQQPACRCNRRRLRRSAKRQTRTEAAADVPHEAAVSAARAAPAAAALGGGGGGGDGRGHVLPRAGPCPPLQTDSDTAGPLYAERAQLRRRRRRSGQSAAAKGPHEAIRPGGPVYAVFQSPSHGERAA